MAGDASVLKDEIEKIQDALGEADDDDAEYDSDEPTEDQLFIDLGLSSKDRTSTYHDVSSASTSAVTGTFESLITDDDSKSQDYSIADSTGESNTTELPVDVETCLALNRAYQEIITEHLDQIKKSLEENREKQRLLEANLEEGMKAPKENRNRRTKDYTQPFFSDDNGMGAPQNEDVKIKDFLQEKKQDVMINAAWTIVAQRQLINSVCKDALRNMIQPLMNKREILENKRQLPHCENKERINQLIEELDEEIKKKSRTRNEKLLEDIDVDRIDWLRISTVDFGGRREWFECQKMWETAINPKINKSSWRKSEIEKLLELVDEYGTGHWEQIVQELGTNRSPFQAMQYYQTNLNSTLKHRTWSLEEDKELKEAFERNKDIQADKIRWQRISYLMESRSADQCRKRWISVDPSVKHTKWTPEEDVRLMLAVKLLGSKDWVSCCKYVPQRNSNQCRERYCNYLDPTLKLGKPFTYDEDKKLLQLVRSFGAGCWSKMVPHMPGRTDHNLLSRYKKLQQWKSTADWFHKQPIHVKRILQGLPVKKGKGRGMDKANVNWKVYYRDYGLLPEHYEQQEKDRQEHGEDSVVPLPPLLHFPPRGPNFKTRMKFKDRLAVSEYIDKTLEGKNLSEKEREQQKKDILFKLEMDPDSMQSSSVRKLLTMARNAPIEKQETKRDRTSSRVKVYQDLCSIVKGPDKKPGAVGRPKRFFPIERMADEVDEKKISVAILALINRALAVDGKEVLKTAKEKSNLNTRSFLQERDLAILKEVVLKDGSYSDSKKDTDTAEEISKPVVPSTPESGGRRTRNRQSTSQKRCSNEPTTSATPILLNDDSPSPSASKTPSKSTSGISTPSKPQSVAPSVVTTPSSTATKSTTPSTPTLVSQSTSTSKSKTAPPEELPLLPPNVSNIRGFKSLLLARPSLVRRAGNCYAMIRGQHLKKPLDSFLRPKPLPVVKPSTSKVVNATPEKSEESNSSKNNTTEVNTTPDENVNSEENGSIYQKSKQDADLQSVQLIYVYPKAQLDDAEIKVPEDKMVGKLSKTMNTVHIRKNLTSEEEEKELKTLKNKKKKAKAKQNARKLKPMAQRTMRPRNPEPQDGVADDNEGDDNIVITKAADDSVVCQIAANSTNEHSEEEMMMNSIKESDDYKRLRARFQSIFMWPALLSSTYSRPVTEQDIEDEQTLDKLKEKLCKRFGIFDSAHNPTDHPPIKRQRGRPRTYPKQLAGTSETSTNNPVDGSSCGLDNQRLLKRGRGRPPVYPKTAVKTSLASQHNPDESLNESQEGDNSNDGETPGKKRRGRPKGSKTMRVKICPDETRHSARQTNMVQPSYKTEKKPSEAKSVNFHSYCIKGIKMAPMVTKFRQRKDSVEEETNSDLETENTSEGNEFDTANAKEVTERTFEGDTDNEFDTVTPNNESGDLDPNEDNNLDPNEDNNLDPNEDNNLDPNEDNTLDPNEDNTLDPNEDSNLEPKSNEDNDLDPKTVTDEDSNLDLRGVDNEICDGGNEEGDLESIDSEFNPIKRKRGRPSKPKPLTEEVEQESNIPRKRGRPPKKRRKNNVVKIKLSNSSADVNSNNIDQSQSSSDGMVQSESSVQTIKEETRSADKNSETGQSNSAIMESDQSEPLVVKLEFKSVKNVTEASQSVVEVKQETNSSNVIEMDQSEEGDDGNVIKQEVTMETMEEG